jgi:RHS repeat-associated protein
MIFRHHFLLRLLSVILIGVLAVPVHLVAAIFPHPRLAPREAVPASILFNPAAEGAANLTPAASNARLDPELIFAGARLSAYRYKLPLGSLAIQIDLPVSAGFEIVEEITKYNFSQDGLNQLLSIEKPGQALIEYLYDADGNRKCRLVGGVKTHEYHWDIENQLVQVDRLAENKTSRYAYDHEGRRIYKDTGEGAARQVVYAGGTSIQEYATGADGASSAHPEVEYIRGLDSGGGVGGLLYTVDASDSANIAVANHRGDIVARYDESGANTYSATYESSGKVAFATGTKPDSHGQNSKEIDPGEVELAYFGYRYFDPVAGVWLSRDPAGFVDGMNLYGYVQNNPWSNFDPDGRFFVAAAIGFAIGFGVDLGLQVYQYNKEFGSLDGFKWGKALLRSTLVGGLTAATAGVGAAALTGVGFVKGTGILLGLGAVEGFGTNLLQTGLDWKKGNFGEGLKSPQPCSHR